MSKKERTVGFSFGGLSPSITEQLKEQNLAFMKKGEDQDTKYLDEIKSAMCSMSVMGIMTDSEREKITGRLLKHIIKHCSYDNRGREICGNCNHFIIEDEVTYDGECDIHGKKNADDECENDFESIKD